MNNIIHFFDLDGTLWGLKTKAWIIDKELPNIPLVVLTDGQLIDILYGIHKKDELYVDYNGKDFWISKVMFDRIKKKKPNITEDKLGISFIEKVDPQYYKELIFHKDNIRHLIEKDGYDIGILSGRFSEESDKNILTSLKKEFDNLGLQINKFYYVSDYYHNRLNDDISYKKANILLEHMVGFHLKNDHFVPLKQDLYKEIYFYDDEYQNIHVANNIQDIFEEYLRNTDDEVYNRIMKVIDDNKPILHTNLVTNNALNRFKTNDVELKKPKKFPIKVEEGNKFYNKFNNFLLKD